MTDHSRQQSIQGNDPFRIISEDEVKEIIQEGSRLIDTLLRQEGKYASIIQTIQLKIDISKRFTEFLLYIIKLFQNAIEDKTITLKNSTRLSIISELTDIALGLHYVLINLSNQDAATTSYDASVAIIIRSAIRVEDIIKGLQRKQWLRWFRSAKNISALVPVFEKITQVVKDIKCIEYKEFSEFLGDVEELRASLDDIRKRVLGLETVGLSTAVLFAIGGIICLIVGGILTATPAAAAGVPLLITGGAGVGVAFATGSGTTLCAFLARKRLDHAEGKGNRKGDKFVCNDTTELSHVQ